MWNRSHCDTVLLKTLTMLNDFRLLVKTVLHYSISNSPENESQFSAMQARDAYSKPIKPVLLGGGIKGVGLPS